MTRQAFYQHFWQTQESSIEAQLIVRQVRALRQHHPVMGGRKLYCLLQPFLLEHQIKLGRDALFNLLYEHRLLVRRKRRFVSTTMSRHWLKKYPNLIKDWVPALPNQLWVADITYLRIANQFLYISLITDACSHKIVGYHIANTMEAVHTASALKMALKDNPSVDGLIHHSDRGMQYCTSAYTNRLKYHGIKISMTQTGDPLENAIAERINGIIKQEYLDHYVITNTEDGMELLTTAVRRYNEERPHQSIQWMTPHYVHEKNLSINRQWSKKPKLSITVNPEQD